MENLFSLHEISPYELVLQDKLTSKTYYCTGPVTGKWFGLIALSMTSVSHIPQGVPLSCVNKYIITKFIEVCMFPSV
jgi:hypothetical protein